MTALLILALCFIASPAALACVFWLVNRSRARRRLNAAHRAAQAHSRASAALNREPILTVNPTTHNHSTRAERRRCFLCSPGVYKDNLNQTLAKGLH